MRETELIERYLEGNLAPEERLLTEAKLIVSTDLQQKTHWQKITYQLVKKFSRKKLREEIQQTEQRLFSDPEYATFRQKIQSIFN